MHFYFHGTRFCEMRVAADRRNIQKEAIFSHFSVHFGRRGIIVRLLLYHKQETKATVFSSHIHLGLLFLGLLGSGDINHLAVLLQPVNVNEG